MLIFTSGVTVVLKLNWCACHSSVHPSPGLIPRFKNYALLKLNLMIYLVLDCEKDINKQKEAEIGPYEHVWPVGEKSQQK